MVSLFSLTGKVAIVAGAGRGIGRAMAVGLAEAGADVVVAARTLIEIENTAAEIRAFGSRALVIPTDVRVSEQVANMVETTLREFNRIDILVNVVGGAFPGSTLTLSEESWDGSIRKNLKTCYLCCRAVAEAMRSQDGGSIINIASTEGLQPAPLNSAYGAAKAGVINLTRSLAVEWAPYRIRVNVITPGFIDGPALPQALQQYPALVEIFQKIPQGRPGKPGEFTGAVIYLASNASRYVTGAMIAIDGGLTSRLG